MNIRVTQMDLRTTDYIGFLTDKIDQTTTKQAEGKVVDLPSAQIITLNRGGASNKKSDNR